MQHFRYEKESSSSGPTSTVIWIAVDDENVIWMATEGGLIKLEINRRNLKAIKPSSVKSDNICKDCNNIRAIFNQDSNTLLIGTLQGLYTYNIVGGSFNNLISPLDKQAVWSNRPVGAISGDGNGNIFIGEWTNLGILLYNKEKKKLFNILQATDLAEFSYHYMRCLFYDSHHVLWAGTNEGILRITNLDEFERNDFKGKINVTNKFGVKPNFPVLHGLTCFVIKGDPYGNIWIGTSEGLYKYSYNNDSVIKYTHSPADIHCLSDNEVRSIYISGEHDAWIGTSSGGLNHLDVSSNTFQSLRRR